MRLPVTLNSKNSMRVVYFAFLAILFVSCSTFKQPVTYVFEKTQLYQADYDIVWVVYMSGLL